jgi:hypothetical protein
MSDETRAAGMEWIVAELDIVYAAQPAMFTEARQPGRAPHDEYRPSDFLRQFSTVIAICLGLATLAHLIVFLVGD